MDESFGFAFTQSRENTPGPEGAPTASEVQAGEAVTGRDEYVSQGPRSSPPIDNAGSQTHPHGERDEDIASSQLSVMSSQASEVVQLDSNGNRIPRATLSQKIEALDWHLTHSTSQQQTVSHFRSEERFLITKSSFNRWVKDEVKLRAAFKSSSVEARSTNKNIQSKKHAGPDRCVEKWMEQKLFENEPVSESAIIQKWSVFQRLYNAGVEGAINQEKPKSKGWVHHFKKRIKERRTQIVSFVDHQLVHYSEDVLTEKQRLGKVLSTYQKKDVFHLDEFGITDRVVPIGAQYSRFTIGICANADGSEILDPLIISHNVQVEGCIFSRIGITPELFWEYLNKLNNMLAGRKIVLVLDRLYEHVTARNLSNINIMWLDKSESPFLNVTRWFKLEFKTLLLKHMLIEWTNHRRVRTKTEVEVVSLIKQSLHRLSSTNVIRESWIACGLIGEPPASPWVDFRSQEAIFGKYLRIAQDKKLVDTIAFSFKDLLFPQDESVKNRHLSDQDIVAWVKIAEQPIPAPPKVSEIDSKKRQTATQMFIPMMDMTQWKKVDRSIHHELVTFFQNDSSKALFPRSSKAFNEFWNEYVSEAMDVLLNEQENYNILPELLNQ
ncbi:CYFA0S02e10594g1_1 [Cyberlindnera fabianii]|uniref:CYFA0S02e10594g1_1 n=1 Tax=Cyberlindnera fabianii TaxID=36022 RepID=A0A061AN57_CYBFA|nr:CYFA0S02e10594g1_1 [Cyberlindnera fabianii]